MNALENSNDSLAMDVEHCVVELITSDQKKELTVKRVNCSHLPMAISPSPDHLIIFCPVK